MAPIGITSSPCDHDHVVNLHVGPHAAHQRTRRAAAEGPGAPPPAEERPEHDRLRRGSNQVVAGVCSGIADYLGIDPVIVRVAFAVLTLTTGLGVPIYAMGWIMMPEPAAPAATGIAPLAKKQASTTEAPPRRTNRGGYHGLAIGMILIGGLLLLRNVNLAIPDALLVPVALAGCGAAVLWARSGDGERLAIRRWAQRLPGKPFQATSRTPIPIFRLVAGLLLVLMGLGVFVGTHQGPGGSVGPYELLAAMAITVVGLALILGPWIWRMTNELTEERRERIRQEERADIAAHLHDSVLQTLALIQRNADNPKEVGALARRQERELRTWLYGDPTRRQNPSTLAGAMEAMIEEVEQLHQVEVERHHRGRGRAARRPPGRARAGQSRGRGQRREAFGGRRGHRLRRDRTRTAPPCSCATGARASTRTPSPTTGGASPSRSSSGSNAVAAGPRSGAPRARALRSSSRSPERERANLHRPGPGLSRRRPPAVPVRSAGRARRTRGRGRHRHRRRRRHRADPVASTPRSC